ncbi:MULTISPECIES: hypothetical protein [unclassified Streptomyces]|uniref:hypothetical protein n=1 Tax=unclassified Streptomyces TaxID=2593676 RepID=UPI002E2F31D7|nr:hypothetical protein [Streptomyces sp. NBC_01280]WSE16434.1 hypothetical protein OG518_25590 [Streptomyces sp. NBC_01397]
MADVPRRLRDGRRERAPTSTPSKRFVATIAKGRHREHHRATPTLTPQRHQLPRRQKLAAHAHQEPRECRHRNQLPFAAGSTAVNSSSHTP